MEKWKKVEHLDKYLISNKGRLKNEKTGRILKTKVNKRGYLCNTISVNGKIMVVKIHRLIAISFIPNPENKITVNHIDGNKTNNNINNLEWATYSENNLHAYLIGIKTPHWLNKFGENHPKSRSVARITKDYKESKSYKSITEAAKQNNVSIGNISRVLSGDRKTAGGYLWRYHQK